MNFETFAASQIVLTVIVSNGRSDSNARKAVRMDETVRCRVGDIFSVCSITFSLRVKIVLPLRAFVKVGFIFFAPEKKGKRCKMVRISSEKPKAFDFLPVSVFLPVEKTFADLYTFV